MNTTISNNGLPLLPQAPGQSGGTAGGSTASAAGEPAGQAVQADDRVRLTDSARALQDAARLDDAAVVDTRRVDAIRAALAAGSYQVDPARIADRMLSLDAQIAGSTAAAPKP